MTRQNNETFEEHKNLKISHQLKKEYFPNLTVVLSKCYKYNPSGYYEEIKDLPSAILKIFMDNPKLRRYCTNSIATEVSKILIALSDHYENHLLIFKKDDPNFFNENATFLVLKSNILLIDKKGNISFTDHSPTFFTTFALSVDYKSDAKCPTFTKFLSEMQPDREDRRMLKEIMGYFLLFGFNELQVFFIMYGGGANGKSVFTKPIKALIGKDNVSSVGLEAFKGGEKFLPSRMVGKAANISDDMTAITSLAEGALKEHVGGGDVTVQEKNKPAFDYTPTAKLMFCTNFIPDFKDTGYSMKRRLVICPWEVQMTDPKKRRTEFCNLEFWRKNEDELQGILRVSVNGAQRILKREQPHIKLSPNAKAFRESLFADSMSPRSFLKDHYEYIPMEHELRKYIEKRHFSNNHELYDHYEESCRANKVKPIHKNEFGRQTTHTFPQLKKARTTY